MRGPTVKLLTWWMLDSKTEVGMTPSDGLISHGIWEARSVYITDDKRVYEFVCVMPHHNDIKLGDRRKMYEEVILMLCHPVMITHLPKLDKRDEAINSIISES